MQCWCGSFGQVTLIDNLENYGIDAHEFAENLQKGVAGSTSVSSSRDSASKQVLVQGNHVIYISKVLNGKAAWMTSQATNGSISESYGLDKKYMCAIDNLKKKKWPWTMTSEEMWVDQATNTRTGWRIFEACQRWDILRLFSSKARDEKKANTLKQKLIKHIDNFLAVVILHTPNTASNDSWIRFFSRLLFVAKPYNTWRFAVACISTPVAASVQFHSGRFCVNPFCCAQKAIPPSSARHKN